MSDVATSNFQSRVRPIHPVSVPLDDVTLMWLDEQVDSNAGCLNVKARLRLLVNVLKTFSDVNTCLSSSIDRWK